MHHDNGIIRYLAGQAQVDMAIFEKISQPGGSDFDLSATDEVEALRKSLPPKYASQVTLQQKLVHSHMLRELRHNKTEEGVVTTWVRQQSASSRGTELSYQLHVAFHDQPGSLTAVTLALSQQNADIMEASVYVTDDGYGLDVFLVSVASADISVVDKRIRQVLRKLRSPPRLLAEQEGKEGGAGRVCLMTSDTALVRQPCDSSPVNAGSSCQQAPDGTANDPPALDAIPLEVLADSDYADPEYHSARPSADVDPLCLRASTRAALILWAKKRTVRRSIVHKNAHAAHECIHPHLSQGLSKIACPEVYAAEAVPERVRELKRFLRSGGFCAVADELPDWDKGRKALLGCVESGRCQYGNGRAWSGLDCRPMAPSGWSHLASGPPAVP